MGPRRRLILVLLLAAGLGGCASCKRKGDDQQRPPDDNAPLPPDHLAPNEVAEGKERAFGLPLPLRSRVSARFDKAVHVRTLVPAEDLANFVRARVKDGKIVPGTSVTRLDDVTPLADPKTRLSIEVRPVRSVDGTRSEMVVRDTTPPPMEPGLTEEERWKKAGFERGGKIADPKHLQ